MFDNVKNVDKNLIQSYILTTAKYDYTAYEKRILYRIIELMQELTEGRKLNQKYSVQTNIFGDVDVQMPVSAFLKDEKDMNYTLAKKSLENLNMKRIKYEDEGVWKLLNLIERPEIYKKNGVVSFRLHPLIASVFLDFSKGYRKYELKTAMQFESVYAMRFYEILSGQKKPLTYLIDELKEMFGLTNKYKETKDFIRRVIEVAKKELDEKSPYSFEYQINKQGKKFHSITFYPIHNPVHQNEFLEQRELQKQLSLLWDLPQEIVQYLKEVFLFDEKEIKQNIEVFKKANQTFDLLAFIASKKRYADQAENPKGYIISCVKKELSKLQGKEKSAEEKVQAPTEPLQKSSADLLNALAKDLSVNK